MTQENPRRRLSVVAAVAALFAVLAGTQAAPAEESTATPSASASSVECAWGPFPAPSDSTSAVLTTRRTPTWAKVLDVPYVVGTFPIHLVGRLVAESIEVSDRIGLSRTIGRLLARRILPPYTSIGLRLGGEDGFGGTFSIAYPKRPGHGDTFRLKVDGTTGGDHGAAAGAGWGLVESGELQLGGGYRMRRNMHFFGVGPDSDVQDEAIFLEETVHAGASLKRGLSRDFVARGAALWTSVGARGTPRDHDPALSLVFDDRLPDGFRGRSEGASVTFELEHDDTPEATRPEHGGVRRGLISYFHGTGGKPGADQVDPADVRFWSWRGELQQFVPLWFSKRSLALRGFVTKIEPIGDATVPFSRLQSNDDPDLLRGYRDQRWRDLGLAVATAEYRWPVWALETSHEMGVDAYIFTDVGQVFHELGEFGDDLTTSYGAGMRLGSSQSYAGRIEIAHSEEGNEIRLRLDQVFQNDKGGLLRGRPPVPER